MCLDCGCQLAPALTRDFPRSPSSETNTIMRDLLADNDALAQRNRDYLDARGVVAINLMSSPGAGKTALLEATAAALQGEINFAVIEGDLATDNDTQRLRARGIAAQQITTGSACHLDAGMVSAALDEIDLNRIELLFIENVGNLVCPASFDLGQHRNVVLLSTPEGDDKPAKYPVMFRAADILLLSKADLLPLLGDFDPARAERCLRDLANPAPVITLSARSGTGLREWCDWLRAALGAEALRASGSKTNAPAST